MKLYKKNIAMLMAGLLALSSGALVTSCDDDDDYDTNQFSNGGVSLTAASLQVTRGAYMTFKGTNLDRVTSVEFPGGVSSTPEVVDEHTIKALVPEGAEPGTVKLIYNGGELETKAIAFTEPITFDDFTPKEVTAGDEISISGTYLTYIEFVQFATGENVEIKNTNRTELKLTVPVDASTGKFNLGYYSVDGKDTVETLLESAEILKVAEPSELKITTPTVKAGQDVEITGKLLRLVEYVSFNGADTMINVAAADPTKDRESIKVALPAKAKDGDVTLTLFSGLEFVAGQVKTVVPTAAIKDKKDSYGVGDIVTIEGENLDLIVSGYLNGTDADSPATFEVKDGNILLNVTKAAKSGDITLVLANGESITVEGFVTTKPVFTFPASATPLDKLSIESTLGERVVKFTFGSVEAEATKTENGFYVQVPLEAENGKLTYTMDNGEEVTVNDNFTVSTYTFCAVTEFDAEQTIIGNLLKCTVKNGQSLTSVKLNGDKTTFILQGTTLFVNVGTIVGKQRMTLVSGEGDDAVEVEYIVKVQGAGKVETLVYTDPVEVKDWGGVNLPVSFPVDEMPDGFVIRIHIASAGSDLQVMDGYWGMCSSWSISDDSKKNNCPISQKTMQEAIDAGTGYVEFDPFNYTDASGNSGRFFWDENGKKWWDGSMMFNADGVIISSIGYVVDYSAPTAIWTGEFNNAGWAGNQDLAWGGYDWSLVDAGQTLYFDVKKVNAGSWGCISLRHGNNWGALVDAPGQYDVADADDTSTIEFTLTQAAIDDLVANGGLVITGDNLILTKVAIK
ncbi:MAG: hypothetical protein ACI35Q_08615 [Marinilabiliaceae bacterium]